MNKSNVFYRLEEQGDIRSMQNRMSEIVEATVGSQGHGTENKSWRMII